MSDQQGKQDLPPVGELGKIARQVSNQSTDPKRSIEMGQHLIDREINGPGKFENQAGKFEGENTQGKFEGGGKNPDASEKYEGKFDSRDNKSQGKFESKESENLGKFEAKDKESLGKFESKDKGGLGKFEGKFENQDKK